MKFNNAFLTSLITIAAALPSGGAWAQADNQAQVNEAESQFEISCLTGQLEPCDDVAISQNQRDFLRATLVNEGSAVNNVKLGTQFVTNGVPGFTGYKDIGIGSFLPNHILSCFVIAMDNATRIEHDVKTHPLAAGRDLDLVHTASCVSEDGSVRASATLDLGKGGYRNVSISLGNNF